MFGVTAAAAAEGCQEVWGVGSLKITGQTDGRPEAGRRSWGIVGIHGRGRAFNPPFATDIRLAVCTSGLHISFPAPMISIPCFYQRFQYPMSEKKTVDANMSLFDKAAFTSDVLGEVLLRSVGACATHSR